MSVLEEMCPVVAIQQCCGCGHLLLNSGPCDYDTLHVVEVAGLVSGSLQSCKSRPAGSTLISPRLHLGLRKSSLKA